MNGLVTDIWNFVNFSNTNNNKNMDLIKLNVV